MGESTPGKQKAGLEWVDWHCGQGPTAHKGESRCLTKEKEYDTSVINKIKDKHAKEVQVEEEKLDKLVKENDATAKYITEMRHYVATKQNEAAPTMKSAVKRPFKLVVYNNTVTMGEYNNEPIQWSVISDRDGTLLLISKKCIDACKRNEVLYTLSKIRQEAFSEEEKMYMLPVRNVYGSEDYKHITTLKHSEVLTYFFRKEKRVCEFTKLAGDKANFRLGKISWWIADGDESVNGSGNFSENNSYNLVHGIRPVIKIKKKL